MLRAHSTRSNQQALKHQDATRIGLALIDAVHDARAALRVVGAEHRLFSHKLPSKHTKAT